MVIERLPILDKMLEVNKQIANFKLSEGYSAETSGGIFCMVEKDKVKDFVAEH